MPMGIFNFLNNDKQTSEADAKHDRIKLLEYIENKASKNDFVDWLNSIGKGGFSQDDDWDTIQREINKAELSDAELHKYASSLSSDTDIKKLLKDVEDQTSQAVEAADKLSLLSNLKKFAIATGGANLLLGIGLIVVALGLWLGFIAYGGAGKEYLVGFGLLVGGLQILSGVLLISE